ncbi:MAG: carboxypeptidase-like regulatory domain-containing protein, partial [Bacteroidota bacterium]
MRKLLLLFCLCFMLGATSFAQQTISGKITDASTGSPMEGVSIQNTMSGSGTTTDKAGMYSIAAKT